MKLLFGLLFLFVLISCGGRHSDPRLKDKNVPLNFDLGEAKNGIYSNNFFQMKLNYDTDWHVQSTEEMDHLMDLGKNMAAGDNETLKRQMDASEVNTAALFATFKYEVGALVPFNPSFLMLAENVQNNSAVKNGNDYLSFTLAGIAKTQMQIEQVTTILPLSIGNKSFHTVTTKTSDGFNTITQEYVSTVINGFAVVIIISYANEEDKLELYKTLNSIAFNS